MGIGALHTVYAIAEYHKPLGLILRGGLIGAVEDAPAKENAFWFLVSGLLTLFVGRLIHSLDTAQVRLPPTFIIGFLLLSVLCVAAVPHSGAWLLLLPAAALLASEQRS